MPISNVNNNSFATATQLTGINSSAQGAVDQLLNNSTNPLDFYRFKISGSSTNLRLNVTGIKGDVKLSLFKASSETTPAVGAIEISLRAENKGTISESYNSTSDSTLADLAAGTYYIKIERSGLVLVDSTYSLDVFASSSQSTVSALWRNPSGGLDLWQTIGSDIGAKGQYTAIDAPSNFQLIGTTDIDADGIDDILWKDTVKNQFFVWFMENGTDRRDNLNVYLKDSTNQALAPKDSNWKIVGIEDIDKDGSTDFLLRNQSTGELNAWFMKDDVLVNDVNLTSKQRLYSDWQMSGFSNGRILWRNINSNIITTWDIDRSGVKLGQVVTPTPIGQNWKVVAFRDFNKDGIADILWRNSQTETIAFWKMKSTFQTPPEFVAYQVPNNFRIAAISDFTGDGRPDILFWNGKSTQVDPNGGAISLWEFVGDGMTVKASYVKRATVNPNVFNTVNIQYEGSSAELVKDFDGDGKADILWRDQTSGATVIWKMNGDVLVESSNALGDLPLPIAMAGIQYDGFRTTDSLNATTKKRPQFTAGLSVPNAFDLGVLDGSGSFIDRIGGMSSTTDRRDWYKFTVETASLLTGINTTPGVLTKVYAKRSDRVPTTVSDLNLISDPDLVNVFEPNTYYINVVFPQDYASPGTPLPYTLNFTGRLGITNLSLVNSKIELDKSSLALDLNSANNKVTIAAYQLENTGDFEAKDVTVAYYLSKDGVLDVGDRLLTPGNLASSVGTVAKGVAEKVINGVVTTPGVPYKTNVGSIVLNLPGKNDVYWSGQSGSNYQIIAVVNPENPYRLVKNERKFDDNAKSSTAITITGIGNADLTGGGFTGGSTSISNTGTATGAFTITNLGGVSSATPGTDLKISFYFSTDDKLTGTDLFLGNQIITATQGIAGNASFTGSYAFSLFKADNPDYIQYWAAQGPVGTQISGFIGMIIDPKGDILDANSNNNKDQGLNKDQVAIKVTIAPGTTI